MSFRKHVGPLQWAELRGLSLGNVPGEVYSSSNFACFMFSVRSNVRMTLQDFLEQRLGRHRWVGQTEVGGRGRQR